MYSMMPSYKYLAFGHYFSWFSSSPFLSFFLFPFCFFAFPGERGCTQSALHCGESRDANKYYSQRPCRYRAVCREAYTIHIANFAVRNGVWPPLCMWLFGAHSPVVVVSLICRSAPGFAAVHRMESTTNLIIR